MKCKELAWFAPVADGAKLYLEPTMGFSAVPQATMHLRDSATLVVPCEKHWYAVYTCANHEKQVAGEAAARGVEHFLPLYSSVRRWKDRRLTLELPLFPGYLFVRLELCDRLRVLQIPSVVRLVGFNGEAVAVPDEEIAILRSGLSKGSGVEPHPFLTVGRRVQVIRGPFAGLQGILLRRRGSFRIVISVEFIQRSLAISVDAADVAPLVNSQRASRSDRAAVGRHAARDSRTRRD
jgi:transcription antitermination factor NusG